MIRVAWQTTQPLLDLQGCHSTVWGGWGAEESNLLMSYSMAEQEACRNRWRGLLIPQLPDRTG